MNDIRGKSGRRPLRAATKTTPTCRPLTIGRIPFFRTESFESPMNLPGMPALSYEDWVTRGIEAVQRATAEGRPILFSLSPGKFAENDVGDVKRRAAPGESVDFDKLYPNREYKLALFLICAGERSYLVYQYSRNAAVDRRLWAPNFPEFHKPLGPPKAPAVRNGFTYTREFEHASVRLDLVKRQGRISWRTPVD